MADDVEAVVIAVCQSGLPAQIVVGFGLDSRNRYFDPTDENVVVASQTSDLPASPMLIDQGSAQCICNAFYTSSS